MRRRPVAVNVVELRSGEPIGTDHQTATSAAAHLQNRVQRQAERKPGTALPEVVFVHSASPLASDLEPSLAAFTAVGPEVQVVVSVTQKELFASPGEVLRFRDRIRARGWALAVRNVGVDPASLAMLPLLEPEVIGLDAALVQRRVPDAEHLATIAVTWARKWGALVVAEGVHTPAHRDFALSVGAQLGHGPLWSTALRRPVSTASQVLQPWVTMLSDWAIGTGGPGSPAQVLDRHPETAVAPLPVLLAHSHRIEALAVEHSGPSSILLAAFQHRRRLGAESADRFRQLGSTISFVGVVGVAMSAEPLPGVRGAELQADDVAALEWNVVTISPTYEAALISRETTPSRSGVRRFEHVLTQDSALVRDTARIMLRRFTTPPTPRP